MISNQRNFCISCSVLVAFRRKTTCWGIEQVTNGFNSSPRSSLFLVQVQEWAPAGVKRFRNFFFAQSKSDIGLQSINYRKCYILGQLATSVIWESHNSPDWVTTRGILNLFDWGLAEISQSENEEEKDFERKWWRKRHKENRKKNGIKKGEKRKHRERHRKNVK